jgi:hypothetical protein
VKRQPRPALITNAELSQHDQLRTREVRYVLMMGFRAVCLVAAAVLTAMHAPLLPLWIPICLFGMLVVPWLAVIIANDRPPKEQYRLTNLLHRQHTMAAAGPAGVPGPAPSANKASGTDWDEEWDPDRIIDVEP